MKALLHSLFSFVAVLLLLQLASAQTPALSPFSADMQINSTSGDHGLNDVTGKIFVGSGHIRMNMENPGHETVIITDLASQTIDILMPRQQMYIEHKASDMPGHGSGRVTDYLKNYDPANPCANQPDVTCKKIGVEEVDGRTCDHWEFTKKGGMVWNEWIDQKLHFAIKVVTKDSTLTLTNIKEGQPEASLFQIPEDYRKMDMGGMMPPGMSAPPHP